MADGKLKMAKRRARMDAVPRRTKDAGALDADFTIGANDDATVVAIADL